MSMLNEWFESQVFFSVVHADSFSNGGNVSMKIEDCSYNLVGEKKNS